MHFFAGFLPGQKARPCPWRLSAELDVWSVFDVRPALRPRRCGMDLDRAVAYGLRVGSRYRFVAEMASVRHLRLRNQPGVFCRIEPSVKAVATVPVSESATGPHCF